MERDAGIYSSLGGYADAVEDGRTGVLMDSMDAEEWQFAIYKLATDSVLMQSIIEQARAKVNSKNILRPRSKKNSGIVKVYGLNQDRQVLWSTLSELFNDGNVMIVL